MGKKKCENKFDLQKYVCRKSALHVKFQIILYVRVQLYIYVYVYNCLCVCIMYECICMYVFVCLTKHSTVLLTYIVSEIFL